VRIKRCVRNESTALSRYPEWVGCYPDPDKQELAELNPTLKELREHPDFMEGRRQAEAEIESGSLQYRIAGKLDWITCEEAAAILNERFGIHVRLDDHCMVPDAALNEGFNERMVEELVLRFDRDVVAEVFREVERKRKKRR
jgi:hypothetical protein